MEAIRGALFDIQHFCTHDGPGIRTTLFLKGCPLRCRWCHNPESQRREADLFFHASLCIGCASCEAVCPSGDPPLLLRAESDRSDCGACLRCAEACPSGAIERIGRTATVAELLPELSADRIFFEESGGGVTISGGEPLAQPRFVAALLRALKAAGLHTTVETCGFGRSADLLAWLPFVDLFLWDIKTLDAVRHETIAGVSLAPILENLRMLDAAGAPIRLRSVYVPDVHPEEAYGEALAALRRSLRHRPPVEILPYHRLGGSKYEKLGCSPAGHVFAEPDPQTIARLQALVDEP